MATVWEEFDGGPFERNGSNKTSLSVSINKAHTIRINLATHRLLGEPEAVKLRFARQENVIGVIPANLHTKGAFPIKKMKSCPSTMNIQAAAFCRSFGIKVDRTERFDNPVMDDQGTLRLDLTRTRPASLLRKRNGQGR